ncbi:chitotriosidase-1-like [Aphidius gifuensis]|uniref:chitotriosidase-1-like n=1 Tax=Aphidius gifuensis TaxID=684658 RepID=UPI001CDCB0FC|nr:chitotriosidase-1-like [Aphidius gifuensis]
MRGVIFLLAVVLEASVVTTHASKLSIKSSNYLCNYPINFFIIFLIENVVCYVADWTIGRPGRARFDIDNVDANLCTHVIYSFVGLTDNNDIKLPERGTDGINKLRALKNINRNLKTMVAVGGGAEGSKRFSRLVSSPNSRGQFIQNSIRFMKNHNLDGLDLDWEYPAQGNGASPQDVPNYTAFVREFKNSFGNRYLLTAAVPSSEWTARPSYDIRGVCNNLDFVNLMAYDLHNAEDPVTGMQAGLYGPGANDKDTVVSHLSAGVSYWINNGCPARKLNLGVPFYAKTWTLANPNSNGVGARASGPGSPGPLSGSAGSLAYFETCAKIGAGGWTVKYNNVRKTPYAYRGNQWIGFENVKSLKEKVQYAKQRQLAGMMAWAINDDDFRGSCGQKFPLLRALNTINN